jgi:hypothetical protein
MRAAAELPQAQGLSISGSWLPTLGVVEGLVQEHRDVVVEQG